MLLRTRSGAIFIVNPPDPNRDHTFVDGKYWFTTSEDEIKFDTIGRSRAIFYTEGYNTVCIGSIDEIPNKITVRGKKGFGDNSDFYIHAGEHDLLRRMYVFVFSKEEMKRLFQKYRG